MKYAFTLITIAATAYAQDSSSDILKDFPNVSLFTQTNANGVITGIPSVQTVPAGLPTGSESVTVPVETQQSPSSDIYKDFPNVSLYTQTNSDGVITGVPSVQTIPAGFSTYPEVVTVPAGLPTLSSGSDTLITTTKASTTTSGPVSTTTGGSSSGTTPVAASNGTSSTASETDSSTAATSVSGTESTDAPIATGAATILQPGFGLGLAGALLAALL